MKNRRKWWQLMNRKTFVWFTAIVLGFMASRSRLFSQDAKKATDGAPAAPAAAPATTDTAAAATAPPAVPDYFWVANQKDPTKNQPDLTTTDPSTKLLKWPDATGQYAGAWATPAQAVDDKGIASGEVPSTISPGDLYDRIAHNTVLDQFRVDVDDRLLGHVHAGRLCDGGSRLVPREELCAHLCA